MKWKDLAAMLFGGDIDYLPPVLASIVLCLLVMSLCLLMHKLSSVILPGAIKLYAYDYFKCLAFCAYPLGYGFIRNNHGPVGYIFLMVPVNVISLLIMPEGSVSPIEQFLAVVKGIQPLWKSAVRTVVQVSGAVSAFYLAKHIINLEFHKDFPRMVSGTCAADLKIPVVVGFLLEMVGTFWETFWWTQKRSRYPRLDLIALSFNTSLVVSLGVHLTGMYMQPALATGYQFGCHGTTLPNIIFVYWLGPYLGGYLAWKLSTTINSHFFQKEKNKENRRVSEGNTPKKNPVRNQKKKYN